MSHGAWTHIFRHVPLLRIIVISTNIRHQRQTLSDHVVGEVSVLLAHLRRIVCECGHELQSILSCGLPKFFILNNRDTELNKAVEQRLEHLWCHLREVNKRDECLGKELRISRILDRRQNVEDLWNKRVVFGLCLSCNRAEERCESLYSSNTNLQA